jgi:uncharacterized circularly permuted ATP-grasp superfamily protein
MAHFDEMTGNNGAVRHCYRLVEDWLAKSPPGLLEARRAQAELMFRRIGITFAVYGEKEATERLIPFDIIPRILSNSEWRHLDRPQATREDAEHVHRRYLWRAGIDPRRYRACRYHLP